MDEEKKSGLIAVIIVLVVFGSIGVIAYKMVNKDKYTYTSPSGEDFKVEKLSIGYSIRSYVGDQPYDIRLRNDPKNLENITIEPDIKNKILSRQTIYFTIDPKENLTSISTIGAMEISNIINRRLGIFNKETLGATTEFANNFTEIANCNNITKIIGVIWLKKGPETNVFSEKECVIVQGTDEWEIVRAADRLAAQILTIMS